MKAKRHQILVTIESRLLEKLTAPGGMEFYRPQAEVFSTYNVTQVGKVVAVGEDTAKHVSVGDDVFFRWTVTHDEANHIQHGETDVWVINCIQKYGIADLFAVITDGKIKPVFGFAFVEPIEEEFGFGVYKASKLSEQWGIIRYADDPNFKDGDKVFFGSEHNDNADLNIVLGKQYYIMESSRIHGIDG